MRTISQTIKPVVYILLILLMILWNINCFGQDSICDFNKTCVYGKVIEISEMEIKYKKADFIEGPSYVLDKYDVSYIRFSNGKCDSFPEVKPWFRPAKKTYYDTVKISVLEKGPVNYSFQSPVTYSKKIEFLSSGRYRLNGITYNPKTMCLNLLETSNDKKIKALVVQSEKNRKMKSIGFIAFPLGIIALAAAAAENEPGYLVAGVIGVAVPVGISISNAVQQNRNLNQAIKLYNQKY